MNLPFATPAAKTPPESSAAFITSPSPGPALWPSALPWAMSIGDVSKTQFSAHDAQRFARRLYGIDAQAQPLPSYNDQNFLLQVSAGERYVLKISHADENRSVVEGQNAMLAHLPDAMTASNVKEQPVTMRVPRVQECLEGGTVAQLPDALGNRHFVRLVSYLDGTPMAECAHVSDSLLHNLGESIATMDRALDSFSHPGLKRDWIWDLRRADDVAQFSNVHVETQRRDLVRQIFDGFNRRCRDSLASLPHGIIHGDANDYNLIVDEHNPDRIAGLIDFGDAVHTAVVCEVAITIAYAILRHPDPVAAGALVLRGYCRVRPLSRAERSLVPHLALTRLAVSVTQSVRERALNPENSYISVTEGPAWRVLATIDALPEGTFESALAVAGATGVQS